ncbi:MAG: 4-deoxy-4-formamido-L-arabinose-phosphoundecaprenol deformylase [Sideroxydans sp.]|jgi:peptidoglycan/xylan/chitin deacetylase (PgdA/CDA1 family)
MLKQIALKIDVDTYRGTREGVPRLVEALQRHQAQASFFFTLGADHTGRSIKHVFRSGFISKARRISAFQHHGFKTSLYGTLLPAPNIGEKCADILRAVRDAGFEVGIQANDRFCWQNKVTGKGEKWTQREMDKAVARFTEIFDSAPKSYAAAGWQTNRFGLRHNQHLGFAYSSDTRGTHPYLPTWDAEIIACPQLPTTLPTLDELIGRDGVTMENVAQNLLAMTHEPCATGHVFTLRAELEGGLWLPIFEELLKGWQAQGYELVSLNQYLQGFKVAELPRHEVKFRAVEGSIGTQATQA